MNIELGYRNGLLSGVEVFRAKRCLVTDCRSGDSGHIGVTICGDNQQEVTVYLDPAVGEELYDKLARLFPSANKPVDFPAAVDPVAAIERSNHDRESD